MSILLYPTVTPSVTSIGTALFVREDIAFANASGERKTGLEKTARKAVEKLQAELSKFLQGDETIVFISKAQAPMSGLERYSFGYLAQYVSAVILVLTDKRLLALRVNGSGKWDGSIRICSWSDIESVKVTGWIVKNVEIRFRSGRKETFWGMPRVNGNVVALLVPVLLQQTTGITAAGEMVSRCPECKAALTKSVYQCAGCGLIFKNERTASWLSLVPGGAYFYCRRPLLGILDFFGEGLFLFAFGIFLAAMILGFVQKKPEQVESTVANVVLLAFFLAIEIAVTMSHARRFVREFIPSKRHANDQLSAFASTAGRL